MKSPNLASDASVSELLQWMEKVNTSLQQLRYTLRAGEKVDRLLARIREEKVKGPACLLINSLKKDMLELYAGEFKKRGYHAVVWDIRGPVLWNVYYTHRDGDDCFDDDNDPWLKTCLGEEEWAFEEDMFEEEDKDQAFRDHFIKALENTHATVEVECDDSANPKIELDRERAPMKTYPCEPTF